MANKWNIPDWLEAKVRERDKVCVYCKVVFRNNRYDKASWEHIDNDASNVCELNIALCCKSCNASKGVKDVKGWLGSAYCKKKNISTKTIAGIIRKHIKSRSVNMRLS